MTFLLTLVVFILILGLLIFVHEFGHFIIAKRTGVKVLEFAFGFPPRIFSWKRQETTYSINAIPVGGYVKMLGEDGQNNAPNSFSKKKVPTRLAIVFAGVFFNFLLTIVLLAIGFSIGMSPIVSKADSFSGEKIHNILVVQIEKDSPAQKVGIQSGEMILGFKNAADFQNFTQAHKGETISLAMKKAGRTRNISVLLSQSSEAPLGVGMVEDVKVKLPFYKAIVAATAETGKITWAIIKFLGIFFKNIFVSGKVSQDVTGPVGVFSFVSSAIDLGLVYVLQLTALISINLALINILPFPALDGGRILFIALEGVRGKKVIRAEIENIIHLVGFAILILLILAITYRDIIRFVVR
ncbi:MAG: hypothetical protein COX39_02710 [Candidatus Nealsonbacteria bacterium CG23_combo_of_CG06-09_8_20_14_all_40_13]|uniref:Peptidase M50 domain-containing protein n=1 Tax=Candidatus Nealsonbacteria bacterium CG23_combo_of_CG06-09_8_20_14_all_40_13 TaxID=1974724 RepID=A0A2G9YQG2_9BACT|nr:MAG: hypothetical protein COX39_02710 [Candidatus Nealsonbacteria bacterium CG23_combo_of_CG06-09_8_20_14_all_40_13]PIR70755.1 MAG: hypothetical protein COU44_03480 [Candidatus Nealsonbacteria bacterium CG10_big_fil_rev_8_21_14_0_10_40_24]